MKRFNGYEEAKKAAESQGYPKLPAGGYICKIMGVRAEELSWGNRIVVQFDIDEGEQKGYFKKQYEANTSEDKKWKGVARITVPADDGSDEDARTKKKLARWISGFEKSNDGYTWDWDENKWKGLKIGILFRETGSNINGKDIVYTEAVVGCPVEQIEKGTYFKGFTDFYAKEGYKGNSAKSEPETDEYGFVKIPDDIQDESVPF